MELKDNWELIRNISIGEKKKRKNTKVVDSDTEFKHSATRKRRLNVLKTADIVCANYIYIYVCLKKIFPSFIH